MPTDSELLLAALKMERRAKLAIPQLPSTFSADVAAITGVISVASLLQSFQVANASIPHVFQPRDTSLYTAEVFTTFFADLSQL